MNWFNWPPTGPHLVVIVACAVFAIILFYLGLS